MGWMRDLNISPISDELCVHAELGAEIVGGFVFSSEQPPINVGMCRDCLMWCCSNFIDPIPLEKGDVDCQPQQQMN